MNEYVVEMFIKLCRPFTHKLNIMSSIHSPMKLSTAHKIEKGLSVVQNPIGNMLLSIITNINDNRF
jgi:hypothetical protein